MGYSHGKDWSFLTKELLEQLLDELGTWVAVQKCLGICRADLWKYRKRLGVTKKPNSARRKKRPSQLDPYLPQIRQLAAKGWNCEQIRAALNLPVQSEQVRRQIRRHGIPLKARRGAQPKEQNPAWRGGKTREKGNYILVHMPDHPQANHLGYVREHRLVMEEKLDRFLEPEEVVHHIDGNKDNNDPDNLQLFPNNGAHLQHEWEKVDWRAHQVAIREKEQQAAASLPASKSDV